MTNTPELTATAASDDRQRTRSAEVGAERGGAAGETRQDGGEDRRQPGDGDQRDAAQAQPQRIRPPATRHGPDHVHRVLDRVGDTERAVHGDQQAHREGDAVAAKSVRVAELVADHGELPERRVEDAMLERRVVLQHEPEDRREQQEQREQRQEPVVGDQRRQVDALIVVELVEGRQRHAHRRGGAAGTRRSARSWSWCSCWFPAGGASNRSTLAQRGLTHQQGGRSGRGIGEREALGIEVAVGEGEAGCGRRWHRCAGHGRRARRARRRGATAGCVE